MIRHDCKDKDKDADVVFAVDLSGSFGGLLSNLDTPFLSDLDADLADRGVDDAAYGVTSYIDYPFAPFGGAGDFIYNTNQPVTPDVAVAQAALDNLVVRFGGDEPEAQLVALQQVALRADVELAYRPDVERFVVLATDASFHEAGDYPAGGANDNDANLTDGTGTFGVEDYPKIAQVAKALGEADVTPIFTVTAAQIATYEALLDQLNAVDPSIGGSVVLFSPDSEDLAAAIAADLKDRDHKDRHRKDRDRDDRDDDDDLSLELESLQAQSPSGPDTDTAAQSAAMANTMGDAALV